MGKTPIVKNLWYKTDTWTVFCAGTYTAADVLNVLEGSGSHKDA